MLVTTSEVGRLLSRPRRTDPEPNVGKRTFPVSEVIQTSRRYSRGEFEWPGRRRGARCPGRLEVTR